MKLTLKREVLRPTDFTDLEKGTMRPLTRRNVRRVLLPLFRLFTGLRLVGIENIPASGPFIIVGNHLHNFDPFILQTAVTRNTQFFAKREIFEFPIINRIGYWTGSFPVERGTPDRWAIRRADAALSQGLGVGIYPEGTRSVSLGLQQPFAGAGLIALRSGAPIVPVIITGSERLPFNGNKGKFLNAATRPDPGHKGVRLTFGTPFVIPREVDGKKVSVEEATDMMMLSLARMLPPDYRGIYADRVNEDHA